MLNCSCRQSRFGVSLIGGLVGMCLLLPRSDASTPPDQIACLPVVLVSTDQAPPTPQQQAALMKHLKWTQTFFAERLNGDTFLLASEKPELVKLRRPLAFYKGLKEGEAATHFAAELLDYFKVSRFDCPYTFCCLVMNPKEEFCYSGPPTSFISSCFIFL